MTEHRLTRETTIQPAHTGFALVEEAAATAAWHDGVAALVGDVEAEAERLRRLMERGA